MKIKTRRVKNETRAKIFEIVRNDGLIIASADTMAGAKEIFNQLSKTGVC